MELMMMKKAIISSLLVVLAIIFDLTFISNLSFSLNLEEYSVAYSNIFTGFVNLILVVIFLVRAHSPPWQQCKQHWTMASPHLHHPGQIAPYQDKKI